VTWDFGAGFSECFSEESLDTIADHGTPNLSGDGDPEPMMFQSVFPSEEDEVLRMESPTAVVESPEFGAAGDPELSRESLGSSPRAVPT
jgi:hypothetical protein